MGDVISKKFDLSLSGWVWTIARYPLAQFVPINKKTDVCAWTPKNPETDFGLFTRDWFHKMIFRLERFCHHFITEVKINFNIHT